MSNTKTVFMFSGQGSHYFQMGREVFDRSRVFRTSMRLLDEMVRPLCGASVIESIYSPANSIGMPFNRTLLTHPAIFMVEYSLARALIDGGIVPDRVLGISLGSFAAATLAGVLDVEHALTAVVRQARSLTDCCDPGGMIGILADPQLFGRELPPSDCELAGITGKNQFVVSAPHEGCAEIERRLTRRGVAWQRLAVSFAFHSRWIDAARGSFARFMQTVPIRSGELPLVCGAAAGTVSSVGHAFFWDSIRRPMRLPETVACLEREGGCRYVDVGPAGSLATALKYLLAPGSPSTIHPVMTPYGADGRNWRALTGRGLT